MRHQKLLAFTTLSAFFFFLISCGGGSQKETQVTTGAPKSMVADAPSPLETKIAAGKIAYDKLCITCHQADGKGLPVTYPPLAGSDYLAADLPRAIAGVVNGLSGEITVNGVKYNQIMPKAEMTDVEIADAFTYVLNNFGNKGGEVNAADVKAVRK